MENELKIELDLVKLNRDRKSSELNTNGRLKKRYLFYYSVSFLIYAFAFYLVHFIKERSLLVSGENALVLFILLISVSVGTFLFSKFSFIKPGTTNRSLIPLFNSFLISLGTFTVLIQAVNPSDTIRNYALLGMFIGLVLEAYLFTHIINKRESKVSFLQHKELSIRYLLIDGFILTIICYICILRNTVPGNFFEKEVLLLGIIFISWLISAATTHKFIPSVVSLNRMNALELQVKFYLRLLALVILAVIFLSIDFDNAFLFIRAFIAYSFISSIVSMFLFAEKIQNKTDESTVVFLKAYEVKDQTVSSKPINGNVRYKFQGEEISESNVKQKFQFEYLKNYGEVFAVLNSMLDLASFDTRHSLIIKSDEPNDVATRPADSYQLLVNLHVLNDQKHLNTYILDVKKTLVKGGVFVGALLPHHYRYKKYLKKYPFWLANTLYSIDFMWKRVLPKLPITREIYATFSKEHDRAISLAEGLGRLVYCGFKIIDLAVVDDVVYFAALKNGAFSPAKKFFYSPLFKMKRVGKDGKPIFVYKLRTMYPYSEFIQDFVYNHNKLEAGGKFKDDFRVPVWGKLFRKLWIDELPMLYNWLKGDLKLVGVRPISNHYLSLYSPEHQARRIKFKPGLLPPFYADMPDTLEEIELSEKRYMELYEKNPIKTDLRYFFKALHNILINRKRSS